MTTPLQILLVEDDDIDVISVKRALKESTIPHEIFVATDGVRALEMLRSKEIILQTPVLIILDLNLPRMDGHEFLAALRADPALSHLVVFVLTTSSRYEDMLRSYEKHVAGYVVKSRVGTGYSKLRSLVDNYSDVVELLPFR